MKYSVNPHIARGIFRNYDIRGVVGSEGLNEQAVYSIARAIGAEALSRGETSLVCGRDGRLSSPALGKALQCGLLDSGCHLIDLGEVPTPLVYFATHWLSPRSGVMLTGSHNPGNYNGLKIVLGGKTLAEKEIESLYQRIVDNNLSEGQGSVSFHNIIPDYIDYIVKNFSLSRRLKVVIDSGNGIAGVVAPELFRRLGCEVIELFSEVDGHFPNHHPDPSRPENIRDAIAAIKEHGADLALAFDGDADRLGVVTNEGEMIFPDRQMMVFAKEILQRYPGAKIVYDVKCSKFLTEKIRECGGEPIMWKTGHSLLKAKLWESGAPLAGEMSGHIFFKDRWFGFDDGLFAGVRLLEIVANDSRSVAQLFAEDAPKGESTPEINIDLADDKKFSFIARLTQEADFGKANVITLDGLRVEFSDGWGLVRASNTTPCLVLRFEADNAGALARIQALFKQALLTLDPTLTIPF